jgi:hypothetical protein
MESKDIKYLAQIKEQCRIYLSEVFDIDEKYFLLEEITNNGAVVSFIIIDYDIFLGQNKPTRIYKEVLFENDLPIGYKIYED